MVRSRGTAALGVCVLAAVLSIITVGEAGAQAMRGATGTRAIGEVLKAHTDVLMAIPGVVGTAQGLCNGKPCIKVYVIRKTPDLERRIPDNLEGHPVEIEETGEFKALSKE